jgi:hypothetical protein
LILDKIQKKYTNNLHLKYNIIFILFFINKLLFAQTNNAKPHEHTNEIGLSNAPVYFVKEKTFTYGLHLHYVHSIPNSKFGLGLGYEHIFDKHKHTTYGIVAAYQPREAWTINLSPGITVEENNYSVLKFSTHLETSYEWEYKNFHYGPAFEIAYDPEDIHLSLGLHIGFGF